MAVHEPLWLAVMGGGKKGSRQARRRRRLLTRAEKEQSAMEYLLTYSWAILIIAVVLAVLFETGVFSSFIQGPRAQPGSCQVYRTAVSTELVGTCSGLPPEFVAQMSGQNSGSGGGGGSGGAGGGGNGGGNGNSGSQGGGQACVNSTIPTMNIATGGYNTVSFWMDWNGTLNESPIGFPGYFLWLTPNSCLGFTTGNNDAYGISSKGMAGTWTMVTIEYYNGPYTSNSTLYINGVQQTLTQCLPTAHTGLAKDVLLIGSSTGSKYRFTGGLSDVQVYNTSLDSETIQAMYYEGIGGAPVDLQHLVAWFPLNSNANDYSGNNQNLVFAKCSYSYLSSYTPPT